MSTLLAVFLLAALGYLIGGIKVEIDGKTFDGIGFALPIDGVKIIVDAIIQSGKFT